LVREQIAVLLVSELAANAVVHAGSEFDIEIERTEQELRVAVTDRGAGSPTVRTPTTSEYHGRGLRIVEALSTAWGSLHSSNMTKTVWFTLDLLY
jgi:anti-sigma regulatory factor (Ser/Thr protein kinase)